VRICAYIVEFPGISGKQIRERYINKIDPAINKDQWTKEEDLVILNEYHQTGCKWSQISAKLNGRPENMVKNRFYGYIRRVYLH
jgi:myb proto-oncogene protein